MNKNRKMVIVFLFAFVLCFSLAGCTLQDRIEEYSSGKEQCYLNTENVTRFSYKGNDYTILADTVSNGGLGEWIGYIRQLAAIDENGKILLQENVEPATFQSLADLAEKAPEAAYIIPFLNVYAAPNADDYLIVDVNGGYHKAVISENVKDSDTVFDFKITEEEANRSLTGNSQEILRIVNTVLPDDDKVRTLVRQAAQDCENYKDPQNNFVMFSEEEFNKFMGRYEKWNEAIAKDYLHQEEPLFDMKRKEGERWTPENRFMYEDIVRFFGGVVIRQQRYIEALQKDINTLKESRLEAAKGLEDANVDEETKKILQSLSEQIINQQKDIQRALENSEKIDAVRDKNQEVKVRSLTVGNELIDLRQDYDALQKETKKASTAIRQESKERDKELKAMIRELEQTSLWFRLRRKWRHITGKDK